MKNLDKMVYYNDRWKNITGLNGLPVMHVSVLENDRKDRMTV